jgi:hypothetical protein
VDANKKGDMYLAIIIVIDASFLIACIIAGLVGYGR